jgi:steroid 5-alpha reductase family enzyme
VSSALLAILALAGLCVGFLLVYLLARGLDNFGIVDIAWSYSFAALAGWYSLRGAGWPERRALVAAMATLWSLRLGTHLLVRIARKHPEEDGRYRQLRQDWGAAFPIKMAAFFQLQAASVVLLGVPFLAAAANPQSTLAPIEWAGALLWLFAISGEALSDAQLAAFRRQPTHAGRVCDVGLWRYSRHPNYFFEWLIWVAFFLFGCASPGGWAGILSPACILFLLLRVTGIPATEEQSIRSKGEAYRRYQERTSAFVPLPPRKFRP